MFDFSLPRLLYVIPAIILALTFHEYAHARMAYAFGDNTAKAAGRMTINPIKHLDPIGTILLILAGFGWAKPVPVNPLSFRGNRRGKLIVVSIAGPLMNLLQAVIGAGILALLLHLANSGTINFSSDTSFGYTSFMYFFNLLQYFVSINVVLAVFNIIPVPPLDGSKLLTGLLPESKMNIVFILERYGFVLLLVLMLFNVFDVIISVPAGWLINLIYGIFGL